MATGCIYILTNPSFPNFVIIGYADNVQERVKSLNASTAVPFEFQIYATYDVTKRCDDHEIHKLIDLLNPDLRAVQEKENGKLRKREFYAMDPEQAYTVLEIIATLSGTKERLKKRTVSVTGMKDRELAEEIEERTRTRRANFSFSRCKIEPGSTIVFADDESITCTVVSDKKVSYQGREYTVSGLACELLEKENIAGTHHFKYKGELLKDIDSRINPQ